MISLLVTPCNIIAPPYIISKWTASHLLTIWCDQSLPPSNLFSNRPMSRDTELRTLPTCCAPCAPCSPAYSRCERQASSRRGLRLRTNAATACTAGANKAGGQWPLRGSRSFAAALPSGGCAAGGAKASSRAAASEHTAAAGNDTR
jgi:hypothetical protein